MDEFSYVFELFALLLGLAVAEMLGGFAQVLKLRARPSRRRFAPPQDERSSTEPAHPEEEPSGSVSKELRVRVGWLVPLLALLVLVDLATFWNVVWQARHGLEMTLLTVFCMLALIGGYYLVATQVFPDRPELWPDFDDYYRQQKRFVVLGMLGINLVVQLLLQLTGAAPQVTPAQIAANPAFAAVGLIALLNFPAFVWLAFSKRARVDAALMLFIMATQFAYAWAELGVEGLG